MDKLTTPENWYDSRPRIAHLMVMYDGSVIWNRKVGTLDCHSAVLIIVEVNGVLTAWKDRYELVRRDAPLTSRQAGALAALHLLIIASENTRAAELSAEALGEAAYHSVPRYVKLLDE